MPEVVVVGGGHNGLVAGCYLARAGWSVQVLEQSGRLGGGSRTEELLDPPLTGKTADQLRAAHRRNAVQMLVHLATTALPAYPNDQPGNWNGPAVLCR